MSDDAIARAIEAMTDVQRRGVKAAGALVERLVASVDGNHDAGDEAAAAADAGANNDAVMAEFARLWRDSVANLAAVMGGADGATPTIDVNGTGTSTPLRVAVDATTGSGSVEVWLHNPTVDAIDKLRVHCTHPSAHDGTSLDAEIVASPDAFDLPARSSRGVTITVNAPDARAGVYRGLVLVDGLPEQWLPVEITVP